MPAIDWKAVSARIRGLVASSRPEQTTSTATKLGVSAQQLRDAMAGVSRGATIAVLVGIARLFGLDPSWLLTGKYDPATHRMALQSDTAEIARMVNRMVLDASRPSGGTDRNPKL